jgi:O-antigen/teichoic acid export membrane protein
MNKHLVVIAIGRLSQMIIMFVTYRVLSTVLSVPDMGVYYFLLSISSSFGLFFANPIGMYANRMLHPWRENGVMLKNLRTIIKSLFIGSLLTIPLLFAFKEKISLDHGSWLFIVGTLVLYIFSSTLNGTLVPSLNLMGLTNHFVIWTLLTNIIGLILSYVMVIYISPHPLNWLVGQGISFSIFGLIAYAILSSRIKDRQVENTDSSEVRVRRVGKFALPIVVTNLAVWILAQSFRFFYKENINATILGELAFGLGLATSLSVAIEYLFQQIYFPDFYSKINSINEDKGVVWNKLLNKLLPSYIYFTFFLIGLSPFLIRVLADVKFKNSGYYLALGAFVELLRMLGNVFTMATHSEMKTHKAIGPYLSGGAITLFGVLYICHHPDLVKYTPLCLMAGYLTALVFLGINVKKMIGIKVSTSRLLKCISLSIVFLTALFFTKFSGSLFSSILINAAYGLILLFFLYQSYVAQRAMGES